MPWEPLPGQPSDPEPVGPALQRVLRDLGGAGTEAVGRLAASWSELVGAELASRSHPTGLRDGTVYVAASDAATASALRWTARDVAERAEALGLGVSIEQVAPRIEGSGGRP